MKINFTLLIIAITTITFAQNDWKPGYILKTQKDTIWGSLLNKKYSKNSKAIKYRNNESKKETTFLPSEIYGYRFNEGKFYVSKLIDSTNGMRFLEYLINGELNIYFYRDDSGSNHYYIDKDSLELRVLNYKDQIVYKDGKTFVKKTIEYKGVLNFYTRDIQGMKKDISKLTTLNHKRLVNFAKKYHELSCSDGLCIEYGKNVKRKLLLSINFGNISFSKKYTYESVKTNYNYVGAKIHFQQFERNENLFFTIGFNKYLERNVKNSIIGEINKSTFGIPIGVEYIGLKQGVSINGSYTIDLAKYFILHYFGGGLNYKIKDISFQAKVEIIGTIEFKTAGIIPSLGVMYNIR